MNGWAKELCAQVWAMEPRALQALIEKIAAVATMEAPQPKPVEPKPLDIRDGVAHIAISGPIMKSVPWYFDFLGIAATSTEEVQRVLSVALNDAAAKSIRLDIDSPGGSVGGVAALAGDVAAVRGLKPITAHVPDLAASAAYWIASQTDKVTAGPTASVGSIGVYSVVADTSAAYENAGIKTHVVSSHPLKGAFVEGSKVTDDQLADLKRNIDTLASHFVDAVASGRGMSREAAQELATGQVWIGEEAKARGLVDEVIGTAATVAPVAETYSAASAAMETEMDPKLMEELEQLRADKAALEQKNAKQETLLKIAADRQRDDLLTKYADRFPPASHDSVAKLVAGMDPQAAEKFLGDLPQITRPERVSAAPGADKGATEIAADAGERQVAKWLGTSAKRIAAVNEIGVKHFFSDGRCELNDGQILTKDELKKELGR